MTTARRPRVGCGSDLSLNPDERGGLAQWCSGDRRPNAGVRLVVLGHQFDEGADVLLRFLDVGGEQAGVRVARPDWPARGGAARDASGARRRRARRGHFRAGIVRAP